MEQRTPEHETTDGQVLTPPTTWPGFAGAALPTPETRRRKAMVRVAALAALTTTVIYLVWRVAVSLTGASLWLAVPMLMLEVHALLSLALHAVDMWDLDVHPAAEEAPPGRFDVAVLVPTYNEPREVLLPTLAAAVALQPDHETWVLDDGHRPWVAELAGELGIRYRAREGHEGAKAGNVNALLPDLDADLVAIIDADHVVHADFLRHVTGYFEDDAVALVQTPQDFYNLDSFEHADRPNGKRFGEQELFYRGLAAGRNRWNSAFWCGTNAVVRLSALRDVGGLATETVTEDIHTTIRMHRKGYRTVYHNEVLARGLAAANSDQYLNQRLRWGTGAMQVLRIENPAFVSGLKPMQRVSYLSTLLGWFESWRTLGYVLLPPATVLSGGIPVNAPWAQFLVVFLLAFLTQRLALGLLSRGRAPVWHATLFDFVRMPANLQATTAILSRRPRPFCVTDKGRSGDQRRRMPVPRMLALLLVVSAVSFAWYIATSAGLTPMTYSVPWVAHGAALWLAVNAVLLAAAVARVRDARFGAERRAAVRFDLEGMVSVDDVPVRLRDISLTGLRVSAALFGPAAGSLVQVRIPLENSSTVFEAVVRSTWQSGDEVLVGLEFVDPPARESANLALALFRTGIAPTLVRSEPSAALPEQRSPVVPGITTPPA